MLIQLDDRKGHNSGTTMERLEEFQDRLLPHPSYSLDFPSSNFSFFCRSKDAMRGQLFQAGFRQQLFNQWSNTLRITGSSPHLTQRRGAGTEGSE
jgi:hypothetical protein